MEISERGGAEFDDCKRIEIKARYLKDQKTDIQMGGEADSARSP